MFHRHKWEVISAQDLSAGRISRLTEKEFPPGPVTVVLSRCQECRRLRTETLDGHWASTLVPEPSTT